jgi:RHS repeat-associated protein
MVTPNVGSVAATSWGWTVDGLLSQLTTPQGLDLGYEYDSNNLLARVFDVASNQSFSVIAARNGRGQVTNVAHPMDGTQRTYEYDDNRRVRARASGPLGGAPTSAWAGGYDALGRLVDETSMEAGTVTANEFVYDGRGRLLEEQRGALGDRRRYTWSRGGNLLAVELSRAGGAYTLESKQVYTGQRLVSVDGVNIAYDAWQHATQDQHGNTFLYTADGEIRQIQGAGALPVTIVRDAVGLPVAHLEGGIDPRQIAWNLDPAGLPLEVHQSDGVDRTYVAADGMLFGILQGAPFTSGELDVSGNLARVGADVLERTTSFGAGAQIPTGTDERFVFGGLELVKGAVNVHLARHRSYDNETGRFQSPDPIGLRGGPHRFLYADGDPIQRIDPMGWSSCLPPANTISPMYMPPLQAQTAMFQDVYGNQFENNPNVQTA